MSIGAPSALTGPGIASATDGTSAGAAAGVFASATGGVFGGAGGFSAAIAREPTVIHAIRQRFMGGTIPGKRRFSK
jgi:hypothetical protein